MSSSRAATTSGNPSETSWVLLIVVGLGTCAWQGFNLLGLAIGMLVGQTSYTDAELAAGADRLEPSTLLASALDALPHLAVLAAVGSILLVATARRLPRSALLVTTAAVALVVPAQLTLAGALA